MLWLSLLFVLLIIWLVMKWKMKRVIELSRKVKCGIKSYPIVGHALLFFGNGEDRMNGLMALGRDALAQGGISAGWLGYNLYIIAADPVDIKVIMKLALSKGNELRIMSSLLGNGSIFASVPVWRPRRKVIAPIFSSKNLVQFAEAFSRQSAIAVEKLSQDAEKDAFSLWKYITTYTLKTSCETIINVQLNSGQSDVLFLKAFSKITNMLANRILQPWLHCDALYKLLPSYREFSGHKSILDNFIHEAIQSCRKKLRDNNGVNIHGIRNITELIMESSEGKNGLTDEELQEEAMVLIMAGTDTTAVASCFVLSLMARYPDVQEKAVAELLEVLENSDRRLSAKDLRSLKYLEAIIKETLRLYPPVPIITRQIEKDLELPSGITLVQGCAVLVHIWAIHRNQKYWGKDAELFRPERFFGVPDKDFVAFMPFSYGPRNCLGSRFAMMSIMNIVSTILRSYRVVSADESNDANINHKPMRVSFEIMIKDVNGFKVRLENRKNI